MMRGRVCKGLILLGFYGGVMGDVVASSGALRLYAWQPKGHGQYSFFVLASSEEEAREKVTGFILESKGRIEDFDDSEVDGWGTGYYELNVARAGEVVVNRND